MNDVTPKLPDSFSNLREDVVNHYSPFMTREKRYDEGIGVYWYEDNPIDWAKVNGI